MSHDEWMRFLSDIRLIDEGLNTRLATLIFVWSRMRVADEARSRVRLTNLCFEDFLEAIVRLAAFKPWPTEEDIGHAGCLDAGHFIIELQVQQPPSPAAPTALATRLRSHLPRLNHHICSTIGRRPSDVHGTRHRRSPWRCACVICFRWFCAR